MRAGLVAGLLKRKTTKGHFVAVGDGTHGSEAGLSYDRLANDNEGNDERWRTVTWTPSMRRQDNRCVVVKD